MTVLKNCICNHKQLYLNEIWKLLFQVWNYLRYLKVIMHQMAFAVHWYYCSYCWYLIISSSIVQQIIINLLINKTCRLVKVNLHHDTNTTFGAIRALIISIRFLPSHMTSQHVLQSTPNRRAWNIDNVFLNALHFNYSRSWKHLYQEMMQSINPM